MRVPPSTSSDTQSECRPLASVRTALGRLERSFATGRQQDVAATFEAAGTPAFQWFLFWIGGRETGVGGSNPAVPGSVEAFVAKQWSSNIRVLPRVAQVLGNGPGRIGVALVVERKVGSAVKVLEGKATINCATARFSVLVLAENLPEPSISTFKRGWCPDADAAPLVVCVQ